MNKFCALLTLFLFSISCYSQTIFSRAYGDSLSEFSFSAKPTSDKGFILSGYTNSYSNTGNDYYLIKTDSLAHVIWSKIYSGNYSDEAYAVQQTADGGYIIAGYSKSFGATYYDACLIKTNANGDTLWTKIYGTANFEFANTIIQTADGGYVFAGYTTGNAIDSAQGSIYLVKTNSLGIMLWKKVLVTSTQIIDAYSIKQTTDKGYIITGYANGFGEINGDAYLIKTDSLGVPIFTKTYGYLGYDWGNSVQQTSDGGYIIGGTYSIDSASLDVDALIIKTDANGDTLWTRIYGGTGNDYGQSIQQTSDGGYVLGGYTNSFGRGDNDAFLVKVNANGDTLFTRAFGGLHDDEANSVFQTADGGYALVGSTNSFGKGGYDFFLVKTDANGNSSCDQTNIHSTKRITKAKVTTSTVKQGSIPAIEVNGSPILYNAYASTDVCVPVGISVFGNKNSELKIFPNPNSGSFTLSLENFSGNTKITITNILGETVYVKEEDLYSKEIVVNNLPNGTYILQISMAGKSYFGKFLVNK